MNFLYGLKLKVQSSMLTACILLASSITSCSKAFHIGKTARTEVIQNKALIAAHIGISIYEPASNKYWYEYQGDKYFVPASNTKIATCYAAMKYLGDSIPGLRVGVAQNEDSSVSYLAIQPMGDPTFLHPDFARQPAWDWVYRQLRKYHNEVAILDTVWRDDHFGSGWSWNDYEAAYMAERSSLPVYGNVIDMKLNAPANRDPSIKGGRSGNELLLFKTASPYFDSIVNARSFYLSKETQQAVAPKILVGRELSSNDFVITASSQVFSNASIPFVTRGSKTAIELLSHDYQVHIHHIRPQYDIPGSFLCEGCSGLNLKVKDWKTIWSRPLDSMLKPMMHRSDNFFAEQSLLMVSNKKLGYMNDEKIIDTILKTDLSDLPQKPRWVDGSGLSRYNLFTPRDLVAILNKIRTEFGMDRVKLVFATGGEGTISSYYRADSGYIYGKTGTLSGVVAFSGYLYTKKGKLLIFSTLVNNHQASATEVRKAVEKFLQALREKY